MNQLEAELDLCPDLRARLDAALEEECPLVSREGGFIRPGFNADLDNLRELTTGGKQWIARYQAEEAARTGIASLKVGFNSVFGYYIEITHTHRDKVPAGYIRKQTVKNAERYITPELKEYEEKVLTADEKAKELEYELFLELRDLVAAGSRGGCARRPPCWPRSTCSRAWPSWPAIAAIAGPRSPTSRCCRSSPAGIRCSTCDWPKVRSCPTIWKPGPTPATCC